MSLSSLKPFQISLSDIIEKCNVIQLVAVLKSLLKITANLKSQMTIKNIKNTVAKILTLLAELVHYVSSAAKKDSVDFLFGLLFEYQKSSSIYQSIKIISRSQKNLILPLLFIKLKLGYNPKTHFIKQFIIVF